MKRVVLLSAVLVSALAAADAQAQTGGTNQQGDGGGGPVAGRDGSDLDANRGNRPSELPNMLKNGMGNAQGPGLPGDSPTDTGRKLVTQ